MDNFIFFQFVGKEAFCTLNFKAYKEGYTQIKIFLQLKLVLILIFSCAIEKVLTTSKALFKKQAALVK